MTNVTIAQGKLKGAEAISENGFKYYRFLNIPYAKPPVGRLRFKNPEPAEPWEGERDATKSSLENISCQFDFVTKEIIGSEDCLYLNISTPKLPSSGSKLLPVMFYLHGGGFVRGNGTIIEQSTPEPLVDNDVVVVTINYRLGVFGFLSLDTAEVTGNMGLKDQVIALKWVQENIEKFGGDKNNVTIFGVSAGAASVELLMLSSTTRGLFHKAILQSGSSINDWARSFKYDVLASNLIDLLGYNGNKEDKNAVCEFLLSLPAKSLTLAAAQVSFKFPAKGLFYGFVPIVEQIEEGAFICINPYKLLKEGKFVKVPVTRGFCNLEGAILSAVKPLAVKELTEHKNFSQFLPYDLNDEEKYDKNFHDAYLKGNQVDTGVIDFIGDLHFAAGVWLSSLFFAKYGISEYVYKFSYDGAFNSLKNILDIKLKGACHGDDTGYVLNKMFVNKKIPEEADVIFKSKITKLWTNFAKTANPTPSANDVGFEWPKFTETTKAYVNLDKEITIETNYEPARIQIFEEIYSTYEK
uniref:Carboxylic ester hydrolase n=1 Tax=Ectropis obliqua TaxID=248899 RepID=A0A2U3T8K1_ECTOB|nr:putative antennal esterase CXE11 [Ectropis obliqua]